MFSVQSELQFYSLAPKHLVFCWFVSLQQFSVDIAEKASNVCLAHLFTYQDFDEGTLGLAYVAPSKPDIPGGLCSKRESPAASLSCSEYWK